MEDTSILQLPKTANGASPGGQGGPQHPDGQCFTGPRGCLAVVLRPETLATMHPNGTPTHWLLPVDQPDLVRISEWLPGKILWLGAQPPSHLLGFLVDQPLGAWLHPDYVEIQLDGGNPVRHPRRGSSASPHPLANVELARLVVQAWTGLPPASRNSRITPMVQLPRIPDYAAA